MTDIFVLDNANLQLEINIPEVLLIPEFKALLEPSRNKSKYDKDGSMKLRARRELTYIQLAIGWKSPYAEYEEQERHKLALAAAELTEDEWNDPTFRAACRKYVELQNEVRSYRLLKAARTSVDKLVYYFLNIDPEERDIQTGKPIFQVKNLISEINSLNKVQESLSILETLVKRELAEVSSIRAGAVDGFMPE